MQILRIFILIAILLSNISFATTFLKAPLSQLVEQADSAAEVTLKDKKTFMTKMGVIQTEFTFKVNESFNLNSSDVENDNLKMTMIGGTYEGVTSYIDGAPDFQIGEKSFLLLKKIESKIYLSNFSLGKFNIIVNDGQIFYSSSVFPTDAELGKVSKEKMIEMIKQKFKTSFIPVAPSKLNVKNIKEDKLEFRKPAQELNSDISSEEEASRGLGSMWIFFFLMVGSAAFIWWQLRKGASN